MKKTSHLIFVLGAVIFTGAFASADEFVHKGWTWMYRTDGTSAALTNFTADTATTFDAADIPWKFSVGETEYTVTGITTKAFASTENAKSKLTGTLTIPDSIVKIGDSAFLYQNKLTGLKISENIATLSYAVFKNCKSLTSVIIPGSVTKIDNQAFGWCDNIKGGVWLKGPSVSSGTYCSLHTGAFNSVPPKVFLAGPMTKTASTTSEHLLGYGSTVTRAYIPDNGKWTTKWKSQTMVFRYGKNKELDINVDETAGTLTATVTTEHTLTNILASAKHFKEYFDLDTVISITNDISASVEITEEMLKDVTLDAPSWYMSFSVGSQAQLDNLLKAISGPIVVDISAAKEKITVPAGRKVAVMVPDGSTFRAAKSGLIFNLR
jgi:hypothetical protein